MNVKNKFASLPLAAKIAIPCLLLGLGIILGIKFFGNSSKVTYLTETVAKGTLMTSISASGTITSGDTTYITTGSTGTVRKVYVKNGDTVTKNQKLAEITLDDLGRETQTTAWNNYQEALVNVKTAKTQKETDVINILLKKDDLKNAETAKRDAHSGGWNPTTHNPYTDTELLIVDKQYEEAIAGYDAAISNSSISNANISLTQVKASAAYRSYQQVSSTVYAPASGILDNLALAPGVSIGNTQTSSITVSSGTDSTSNSVSVNSQKIGAIKNPEGQYQATVSLTEVDVTTVKSGQKVTLTLDAFPDSSFTGMVLAVNTSGSVSSGVTAYSATILLDKTTIDIYTNMAVSATIITFTKTDVLLVTSSAIQTSTDGSFIQVQKDGKITNVAIESGSSNDFQTEIVSGLSEGDVIVTSTSSTQTKSTTSKNSSGSTLFTGNSRSGGMPGAPGF
ncbi:MAG: HlyD family secretion protein [Candidatus Collierbacteria bacterium GW2011_GWB1_44_35]|uniref:HlyD family secretion protein n=4 Tax=Candidatus Collieribacteriota TaxID=1752725 RepID=A0A0G1LGJ9_9BACT|nr:MAG: HlyD family secretion protein [Candidatus Collierbacteria bacterium GW2011_GWA1_44_12]KKT67862.1 MAG: HlyD family secretion protein [Candidatus Collierbacteria bacterium GW2011_GWB1_44_35]